MYQPLDATVENLLVPELRDFVDAPSSGAASEFEATRSSTRIPPANCPVGQGVSAEIPANCCSPHFRTFAGPTADHGPAGVLVENGAVGTKRLVQKMPTTNLKNIIK